MTEFTQIKLDTAEGIATLTLSRPEKMNAFTGVMMQEMIDAIDITDADDSVRAVIVTGEGDRAFCAGADLTPDEGAGNVFARHDPVDDLSDTRVRDGGGRLVLRLFNSQKPLIGACNGVAVGVGATMQLPFDMRLCSDNARFGFVFARRGITPEACSSWFLPRIVGLSLALEWTYSADILDAQAALDGGLLKAVLPPEQLLDEAYALARRITQNRSPVAVALTRQMMMRNSAQPHPFNAHEIDSLAVFYTSRKDGREGVQAFLDKREADFTAQVPDDLPPFYEDWAK